MEVSELKSFNSETKNVDSSKMSLPEQKTTFGINHLVKEICEGNETWMVESGDIAFKVSLESLQNYSSIQKMALELGHSLLNHNPSQKEWRLALHHLIQSPRIIKKKSEFRLIKEYTFFIDVADMILENNLNSSNYFFTRKNGLFSCLLNKVYTEYESYKIKKNEPPLNKLDLIKVLKANNTIIESGVVCNFNGKTVRAHSLNTSKLPDILLKLVVKN